MKAYWFAILITGCTPSSDKLLPGVTNTPHLETQATDIACGEDIAYGGNTEPDLRYAFAYAGDKLVRADGSWTADGSTETVDYTWDGDQLTRILAVASYGAQSEVVASYDGANLVDYSWSYADAEFQDQWSYAFADFDGANPTSEVISQLGTPVATYQLVYDANARLIEAAPDHGPATTYSYDDAAGVITIDTGNGAFVGTLTYDAEGRPLTESWTGSDPAMIDSASTYAWNGSALSSITYESGSQDAPHALGLVATETFRYSCEAAKRAAGRSHRKPRLSLRR